MNKCHFGINFTFTDGEIIGGEITFYKHAASTLDSYNAIVYSEDKDDRSVTIGRKQINRGRGWNSIQINEFSALLGTGNLQLDLSVQFIKNGEEISCQEAQSVFVTNCNKEQQPIISRHYLPPALVLFSKRKSFVIASQDLPTSRVARTADRKCSLQRKKISTKSFNREAISMSPEEVDVRECVDASNKRCIPKQAKDLHFIAKQSQNLMSVETISNIIVSKC